MVSFSNFSNFIFYGESITMKNRMSIEELLKTLKEVPPNSKLLAVRIIPLDADTLPNATEFAAKLIFVSDSGTRISVNAEYCK